MNIQHFPPVKIWYKSGVTGGTAHFDRRSRSSIEMKRFATPLPKAAAVSPLKKSLEGLKLNTRMDYMTPQRLSAASTRSSLMSEKRLTNPRLSGRSSQSGSKGSKDTRPLSD